MGESFPGLQSSERDSEKRLDSWKEIAAYLNRDITTVQRWEKREGMPIHRHQHDKRGSVYALAPELDAWLQTRKPPLDEEDKAPASEFSPAAIPALPHVAPQMWRWTAFAGISLAVILVAAYFVARRPKSNPPTPKIQSLAVLPLKNLSGDPSQDYLADGMTDELIGRLSGIRDLRVVSRTSVMRFKNPQLSVPEIAKSLHVDAIVEGSVLREGSRIRVTAQLIRASTDEHLWSETYDRELRDVLALQGELAQSIAEKVQVTVTGMEHQRLAAIRPVSPEVYEDFLKGRFALDKSSSRVEIAQSIGFFDGAIKKDPTFAPSYLGLAEAYDDLGTVFIGDPPETTRPRVLAAARKALELDPNLAEAHLLIADVDKEQWHWADAQAEYQRALELSPNNAEAYAGFASWLLLQGRTDEALNWAQRARELDPVAISGHDIGWILFCAHRYGDAIQEFRSELAVQPDDTAALWDLGFVLIAANQPKEAIPPLEKALSLSHRSPGVIGVLIRAYAHAGRRKDALRLLAELQNRRKAGYVPAGAFVNAYLGLGDKEQSFVWLELAYKEQSNILQFLKVHPYFDPIRGDPRFAALLRRVGLS